MDNQKLMQIVEDYLNLLGYDLVSVQSLSQGKGRDFFTITFSVRDDFQEDLPPEMHVQHGSYLNVQATSEADLREGLAKLKGRARREREVLCRQLAQISSMKDKLVSMQALNYVEDLQAQSSFKNLVTKD